jgi:release factor glutamine methyltransferase
MIALKELILEGRKAFEEISETAALDTELLVCHVLGITKLNILMEPDRPVKAEDAEMLRALFKRRAEGFPVQYLIGTEGFMGLEFNVTPSVLIPRPDTELLVEKIIELADNRKGMRILDIGTGSGAIAVSLAYYLKSSQVETVDISEDATEVARGNAEKNGVAGRVKFLSGDVFGPVAEGTKYDVIVSNPPYIPSEDIDGLQIEVAVHEPRLALDGGLDGYDFYRRIIDEAPAYLNEEGILAFETGHDQARTIADLMEKSGNYEKLSIHKDLAGIERVVVGYKK